MGKQYVNQAAERALEKWRNRLEAGEQLSTSQLILYLDQKAEKATRASMTEQRDP